MGSSSLYFRIVLDGQQQTEIRKKIRSGYNVQVGFIKKKKKGPGSSSKTKKYGNVCPFCPVCSSLHNKVIMGDSH